MRRSVAYALLISLPPAFATGSGTVMLTGQPLLGLALGGVFGLALFALMLLGSEYGSSDGRSVGEL